MSTVMLMNRYSLAALHSVLPTADVLHVSVYQVGVNGTEATLSVAINDLQGVPMYCANLDVNGQGGLIGTVIATVC